MKFDHSCSSKPPDPCAHSHSSPACSPSTPCAPVHRGILIQLGGFEILLRKSVCSAELLVRLILGWPADIGLVVRRVRVNVVGFPGFLDHRHLASRKLLQLL